MTTYTKSGSFGWAGGGKSGAIVDLWAASRCGNVLPVQGAAPPSGSPDAGPVTTGSDDGNPGGYVITGITTVQDYYVRIQYGGVAYWGGCSAGSLAGQGALEASDIEALFSNAGDIFIGTGPGTGEQISLSGAIGGLFTGAGYLIVGTGDGTAEFLAAGADGDVFTSNGIGVTPSWQAPTGGSGALPRQSVSTAATITLTANTYQPISTASNAVTAKLPSAPANLTQCYLKIVAQNAGVPVTSQLVTIETQGSDVLNAAGGATSFQLAQLFSGILFQYDSSTAIWTILVDDFGPGGLVAGNGILLGVTPNSANITFQLSGTMQEAVVATGGSAQTLPTVATDNGSDITLSANLTVTMPTAARGAYCYARIRQPASGGTYTYTVTHTGVKWPGGTAPTMSTGASAVDEYEYRSDGTHWYGATRGQAFA